MGLRVGPVNAKTFAGRTKRDSGYDLGTSRQYKSSPLREDSDAPVHRRLPARAGARQLAGRLAHTSGEALARIRLALEADIAARLGRGDALPRVRGLGELETEAPAGEHCFEVHINLKHLQALANHQQGRWN
jgi:hypothetical protein